MSLIISILAERNQNIVTAESCTGGLLSNRMTDVPGSSAVFLAGLMVGRTPELLG